MVSLGSGGSSLSVSMGDGSSCARETSVSWESWRYREAVSDAMVQSSVNW